MKAERPTAADPKNAMDDLTTDKACYPELSLLRGPESPAAGSLANPIEKQGLANDRNGEKAKPPILPKRRVLCARVPENENHNARNGQGLHGGGRIEKPPKSAQKRKTVRGHATVSVFSGRGTATETTPLHAAPTARKRPPK